MSSIVPSAEASEAVPPTEAPLLGSEIAAAEVGSILGTHDESQVPSAQEDAAAMQTSDMQMENMGYDQVSQTVDCIYTVPNHIFKRYLHNYFFFLQHLLNVKTLI